MTTTTEIPGVKTERHFFAEGDRYILDFGECDYKKGFAQCDTNQDADYFGIWANPERRMLVSYIEGDLTVQVAETDDAFVELMQNTALFYEDSGYGFDIDTMCVAEIELRFRFMGLGGLLDRENDDAR